MRLTMYIPKQINQGQEQLHKRQYSNDILNRPGIVNLLILNNNIAKEEPQRIDHHTNPQTIVEYLVCLVRPESKPKDLLLLTDSEVVLDFVEDLLFELEEVDELLALGLAADG
jgi:hypothetical protein